MDFIVKSAGCRLQWGGGLKYGRRIRRMMSDRPAPGANRLMSRMAAELRNIGMPVLAYRTDHGSPARRSVALAADRIYAELNPTSRHTGIGRVLHVKWPVPDSLQAVCGGLPEARPHYVKSPAVTYGGHPAVSLRLPGAEGLVRVDARMADAIILLNRAGLRTVSCCQGGMEMWRFITFDAGRVEVRGRPQAAGRPSVLTVCWPAGGPLRADIVTDVGVAGGAR